MLKALYLRNFRNYSEAFLHFGPGVNAICGPNAQGKTNLLEAVYVLMTGRSFRTPRLADLIRFGESSFYIEALFLKNEVEHLLKIHCDGVQRKIILNSTSLTKVSSLLGLLMGVVLSPEDSELVKGQPASRREFLDLQIAKASPLYLHHLSRYLRAMKHRNHLLRCKELSTIEVWEEEMARSAAYITLQRRQVVQELETEGHPLQMALSGSVDAIQLIYKSSAMQSKTEDLHSYFLSQYSKHRLKEMSLGSTLTGPHRDDLSIFLHDKDIRLFGSEGQQRSCVAALRLAEWERLYKCTEERPLMCIDDAGISLDKEREACLYKALTQLGQVFITTPKEELPLPQSAHKIFVHQGTIYESYSGSPM